MMVMLIVTVVGGGYCGVGGFGEEGAQGPRYCCLPGTTYRVVCYMHADCHS